jgi:hypothetical protein
VGVVKADLAQLKSDLGAARDAKLDAGDLKPLLQSVRELAKNDRADVQQAVQNARDAVKARLRRPNSERAGLVWHRRPVESSHELVELL